MALRTGGSTGAPRSVIRTTDSWWQSFPHVSRLMAMSERSRVYVPGSLSGTMNLFAVVHTQAEGAWLVPDLREATHAHLAPHVMGAVLAEGSFAPGLRVVVAGDRLSRADADRAATAGVAVSHYYGAAELSFVGWGNHEDNLRPFPGVEISVRDGIVHARSEYLARGYDGPPGPFQRTPDGFATVGDLGRFDGGVLTVSGRGSEAVVTGGTTVLTADVEDVLRRRCGVAVDVVGLPHGHLGAVVAAVVPAHADLGALRAVARAHLSPPQRPRRWVFVEQVPRTPAGKVDRVALSAQVIAQLSAPRRLAASGPGDPEETRVESGWR